MKTEGIENIFLTYANISLKDNPEIFYEIFEMVKNLGKISFGEKEEEEIIKKIIGYFVRIVKCKDIKKAEKKKEDLNEKLITKGLEEWEIKDEMNWYDIAFEGVFGYRDGYCEKHCDMFGGRKDFFGEEVTGGLVY